MLRKVEGRGRLESARRLRSTIGSVFRYAIATARAENDPTFALRGALVTPKPKHRPAITDPVEFGGLLRSIESFKGQPTTKAALQLMALLACRPGELRNAKWDEFDLDGNLWSILANRMKMRRPHRVPLPKQAISILKGAISDHRAGSRRARFSWAAQCVAAAQREHAERRAMAHGLFSG